MIHASLSTTATPSPTCSAILDSIRNRPISVTVAAALTNPSCGTSGTGSACTQLRRPKPKLSEAPDTHSIPRPRVAPPHVAWHAGPTDRQSGQPRGGKGHPPLAPLLSAAGRDRD